MHSLIAAIVIACVGGIAALSYELGGRHAVIAAGANRCPQFAGGEPLVTAIYHVDGSVACRYSIPRRRMIERIYPATR